MPTQKLDITGTTKTDKLQLGNKFILSGVGDAYANDNWIRMVDTTKLTATDGTMYGNGGIAASKFWAGDTIYAGNGVSSLSWKNYGVGHTIIDASAGTSPSGLAVDNKNSAVAWTPSYPTLM